MKILIIGKGLIGGRCAGEWAGEAVVADRHVECIEDAQELLERFEPDVVLNAAGVRGVPNVDWCEAHPRETVQGNVTLPILLATACAARGIYLLHVGSGCVFYGASPASSAGRQDPGWREDDHANPSAVYSRSKYAADLALSVFPHVGIARIRMPIDSVPSAGNLIDKLAAYQNVIDVENSVTMIPDMIDVLHELLSQKASGIFHVVNPGVLKHRDIIASYETYVDPNHRNVWIANEDLVGQGLAVKGRSNCVLQSIRLEERGIVMRDVHAALDAVMREYALFRNKELGIKN